MVKTSEVMLVLTFLNLKKKSIGQIKSKILGKSKNQQGDNMLMMF